MIKKASERVTEGYPTLRSKGNEELKSSERKEVKFILLKIINLRFPLLHPSFLSRS